MYDFTVSFSMKHSCVTSGIPISHSGWSRDGDNQRLWSYDLTALYKSIIIVMHSVTDRETDRQQDDANSRSYCVAVRSAKKYSFYREMLRKVRLCHSNSLSTLATIVADFGQKRRLCGRKRRL